MKATFESLCRWLDQHPTLENERAGILARAREVVTGDRCIGEEHLDHVLGQHARGFRTHIGRSDYTPDDSSGSAVLMAIGMVQDLPAPSDPDICAECSDTTCAHHPEHH